MRSILVTVNTWILHCKEPLPQNSKQIFPEKDLRGHCPNFHIYVTVSDLYIPAIDMPILLQEVFGPIRVIYINRSQAHDVEIGTKIRPRNSQKGIHKWDFLCSVYRFSDAGPLPI